MIGAPEIFIIFVTILLVLVGLLIIAAVAQAFLKLLFGKLKMKADKLNLARGESVQLEIEIPKNARSVVATLFAEEIYMTNGENGKLYRERVYEVVKKMPLYSQTGSLKATFEIPKDAPPSIGLYNSYFGLARTVGLVWRVHAKADLQNAIDKEATLELKVN